MLQCARSDCKYNSQGMTSLQTAPMFSCGRCIHNRHALNPKRNNWTMKDKDRRCFQWDCKSYGVFPGCDCRYCWHNPVATYTNGKYFERKNA